MAVIVRGISMPESCEDCRFMRDIGSGNKVCGAVDRELIVTDLFLVRNDECPLKGYILGADLSQGEDVSIITARGGVRYELGYGNQARKATL